MFDEHLEICGACGVPKNRHGESCAQADLSRVAELEGELHSGRA